MSFYDEIIEKRSRQQESFWKKIARENNRKIRDARDNIEAEIKKVSRELHIMRSEMILEGYPLWKKLPWIRK